MAKKKNKKRRSRYALGTLGAGFGVGNLSQMTNQGLHQLNALHKEQMELDMKVWRREQQKRAGEIADKQREAHEKIAQQQAEMAAKQRKAVREQQAALRKEHEKYEEKMIELKRETIKKAIPAVQEQLQANAQLVSQAFAARAAVGVL